MMYCFIDSSDFCFADKSLDPLVINSLVISPDVIKKGGTNNLTVSAKLSTSSFILHDSNTFV